MTDRSEGHQKFQKPQKNQRLSDLRGKPAETEVLTECTSLQEMVREIVRVEHAPRPPSHKYVLATVLVLAVLLLVAFGFQVLLQAASTPDGTLGMARAMDIFLRSLGTFLNFALGAVAALFAMKVYRDRKK